VGPVFGDRYRSEAIEDDAYLLGALRYLHLNKVSVLGRLGGSVRGFTEFHRQSDLTLYLETSEDRESYRLVVAHKVLEQFCAMHGIERATQLKRNPEIFSAICRQLTQNAGLTLRKAAETLETSHTKVYQALLAQDFASL